MSEISIAAEPHVHAEVIHAYADGAQIEYRDSSTAEWESIDMPTFIRSCQYRVKPVKVYPVTQMTTDEMSRAWCSPTPNSTGAAMEALANAALRHAIDADQVVTKVDHEAALVRLGEQLRDVAVTGKTYTTTELTLDRYREVVREEMAARELAIAEAVMNKCLAGDYRPRSDDIDLGAIIAKVRP